MTTSTELNRLAALLQQGSAAAVKELTLSLLAAGAEPQQILNDGLIAGMSEVGEKMRTGEMFLPEVLQCASVMKAAMEILTPLLLTSGAHSPGRIVLGTVKGDMHDIGKNLVAALLEGGGFEVVDLGVDVPPARFVAAVEERKPDLLGLSALLTTTMPGMKATLEALAAAGVRDRVKVMVGGAPVTQSFSQAIGADGHADNAASAVDLARRLIGLPESRPAARTDT